MAYLLGKGAEVGQGTRARPRGRSASSCASCGAPWCARSPRRAWFTLSLLAATLLRRPSVFVDAVTLAVIHQALYDYVRVLRLHLDDAIAELEAREATAAALPG